MTALVERIERTTPAFADGLRFSRDDTNPVNGDVLKTNGDLYVVVKHRQ